MKRFDSRRLRSLFGALAAVGAAHLIGVASTADAACVGDCDNDGRVRISEVQRCVNLANEFDSEPCANADQDSDGTVSPDEVLRCIDSFLDATNCPQVAGTRTPTKPPATNTPKPSTPTSTGVVRTSTRTNTPVPTATRTNTPAPTSTRTNTPAPTGTFTVTKTSTRTPTNTQTPTNTVPPTNTAAPMPPGGLCTLGSGSQIILNTALPLPPLPATGQVDIECGDLDPATGTRPCNCGVITFSPLSIAGLFWACINPATAPCPTRDVDCNGGDQLSLSLTANRNIGACTSNAGCQTQCEAKCGGAALVFQSGCEGFCTEGTESPCATDRDCLNSDEGSCNGADNAFRDICDCTCLDDTLGPAAVPGDLQCQLAFNLTVESIPGNLKACDGADVTIKVGDTCAPLTTEAASGILKNANNSGGTLPTGGPFSQSGTPISCDALVSRNVSGLKLRGAAAFYASTIGDILTGLVVNCQ